MKTYSLKDLTLLEKGHISFEVEVPKNILDFCKTQNWSRLDQEVFNLTKKDKFFYSILQKFHSFEKIEHLINRRQAETDEDGIWHDDGSRLMAFSLSLNQDIHSIMGGQLLLRKKNVPDQIQSLGPFPIGIFTIFLTGQYGFEHKVCQVLRGERITLAGWCS